ncbi:MAG: DUF192 domain-containing protein [Deltaproteobacteria bacterium]|nr:DUF192 domain-containing protein [Deltaproteobacteria bacterium]
MAVSCKTGYSIFYGDQCISSQATGTESLWERIFGLLGKPPLRSQEALILSPGCFMIDTFFMKYPIDVAFMDSKNIIVALYPALQPYRMTWPHFKARSAIEWPAGTIDFWKLKVATQLRIEEKHG